MTYLAAALLGVLQGLTEFLPISSTAHLLIAEEWLGFEDPGGVFTVMIQLGSVLAVMWLYRHKIVYVVQRLPYEAGARRFAAAIVIAFIPAAIAGVLEASITEIRGRDRTQPVRFENIFNQIHSSTQMLARGSTKYDDGEIVVSNEGTHGLYSRFEWVVEPGK